MTHCTGLGTSIAEEAASIFDAVREQVAASHTELKAMEEAVKEQLSGKPKKRKKKKKTSKGNASEAAVSDLDFKFDDIGSDSERSASGLLDL